MNIVLICFPYSSIISNYASSIDERGWDPWIRSSVSKPHLHPPSPFPHRSGSIVSVHIQPETIQFLGDSCFFDEERDSIKWWECQCLRGVSAGLIILSRVLGRKAENGWEAD